MMISSCDSDAGTASFANASPTASNLTPPSIATETITATGLNVPGFEIVLSPGQTQEMVMRPIPPVFEDDPAVETFPVFHTSEGDESVSTMAKAIGSLFPVRDLTCCGLGSVFGFALRDESGGYVAIRVAADRVGPGLPSWSALEGVRAAVADPVLIKGPTELFTDSDGIAYYPPERIAIRGYQGLYLQQEAQAGATGLAVNTVVWREDDFYWSVIGLAPSSGGRFDRATILSVVTDYLVQYDPATGEWTSLGSVQ